MFRVQLSNPLVWIFTAAAALACGGSGGGAGVGIPECNALHACCDDFGDPNQNKSCHDQATQLATVQNGAASCKAALDQYVATNQCGGGGGGAGGTGGSSGGSCSSLSECCAKASDAATVKQCQDAVGAYQKSSDPESLCANALAVYEQNGLCGGGTGGVGGAGGSGGAGGAGSSGGVGAGGSGGVGATGGAGGTGSTGGSGGVGATGGSGGSGGAGAIGGSGGSGGFGGSGGSAGFGGSGGTSTGLEETNATCSDSKDNDGDGYTDCLDFSCSKNPAVTYCQGTPGPENTISACSDVKDNDGDGYIDCVDFDCAGVGSCP